MDKRLTNALARVIAVVSFAVAFWAFKTFDVFPVIFLH